VAALVAALHGSALAAAREVGTLTRLAESLAAAPDSVRADFAAVAIGEMLRAYETEFERLVEVPRDVSGRGGAKQARWARAMESFVDGLYAARGAVDDGHPVEILVQPPAPLRLLVGGHLVAVTSPRIANPAALEEAIVRTYCDSFLCDGALLEPLPPPPTPGYFAGVWSFDDGDGSTYETADGLGFRFRDISAREDKERVARTVHAELRRLVTALVAAERSGRRVDYGLLEVRRAGDGDDHRVVLAPGTPEMRLFLPSLARAPWVVRLARPWIRARARGKRYQLLIRDADLLVTGPLAGAGPAR
jgi:hypothetical protein